MDILRTVAIELPCSVCEGQTYSVTLRQVLISLDTLLHEGCQSPDRPSECPPAAFARTVDHALLLDLRTLWQRLEERVHSVGGELSLVSVEEPG